MKNKRFHTNSHILLSAILGFLVVFSSIYHINLNEWLRAHNPFDSKLNSEIFPWKKGTINGPEFSLERMKKPSRAYNLNRNSYRKKYSEIELFANHAIFSDWTLSESGFFSQHIIELNNSNSIHEIEQYLKSSIDTSKLMFGVNPGLRSSESLLLNSWHHGHKSYDAFVQKLQLYRVIVVPHSTSKGNIQGFKTIKNKKIPVVPQM